MTENYGIIKKVYFPQEIFVVRNVMSKKYKNIKIGSSKWNDQMYEKHPTPYHGLAGIIEKLRVKKVISFAKPKKSDSILELGCESGSLLMSFPNIRKMVGLDISNKALEEAKYKTLKLNKNINYVYGDFMKKLQFKKGEFSIIICSEALEHVLNPEKAIRNIYEICNSKTRVIITVPDEAFKISIKNLLNEMGLLKILLPGIEKNQSEWHLHAFSKEQIIKIFSKYFKIAKLGSVLGLHIVIEGEKK